MRYGASFRLIRGVTVHQSGGSAVAFAFFLAAMAATLWFFAVVAAAAICILLYVCFLVAGYLMTSSQLKELQARALVPTTVVVEGNYTKPKTWGVYRVEGFKAGRRGHTFHIGNHPVRHSELVREHGAAEVLMLFTTRADAEHLKHLLSSGLVSSA